MVDNHPVGEPAGGDVPPLFDLAFDSGALYVLRTEMRACAGQAGLSEDRVADVVLAVHELAANVLSHGGGKAGCGYGIWQEHCTARLTTAT